jgi:hypothetical protein
MRYFFPTLGLSLAILSGCNSTESTADTPAAEVPGTWVTIDAEKMFSFRAPRDLVEQPVQGKDSFVGKYDSPALELTFDYGRYSDPLEHEDYRDWRIRNTTIDGKRAKIGWSGDRIAVHFPRVEGNNRLSMFAKLKQPQGREVAEVIFRSVDFP